jgi:glycosyltransferase involved in cell wall biosynthesis
VNVNKGKASSTSHNSSWQEPSGSGEAFQNVKNMRRDAILFATTVIGTADSFLEQTACKAAGRGYEVDLMTNASRADDRERPYRKVYSATWGRGFKSPFGTAKSLVETRSLMKSGLYALVHTHTPTASAIIRIAAATVHKRHRPILIYTAHGFHFGGSLGGLSNRVAEVIERYLLKWTDILIVINDQDELWAQQNVRNGTQVIRTNGVGIKEHFFEVQLTNDSREAARLSLRIPNESFVALSVGELNANKRKELAMDAMANLDGERLLIVIGQGHLLKSLEKKANQLMERHLGLTIRFEGYQTNVMPYLLASDCLIHTSRREGHPIVIVEAMAVGLPVVAFPIRGCIDSLKDGRGFLISGDDAASASTELAKISMKTANTKEVIESARMYAFRFQRGQLAEQTVDIYETLIKTRMLGIES